MKNIGNSWNYKIIFLGIICYVLIFKINLKLLIFYYYKNDDSNLIFLISDNLKQLYSQPDEQGTASGKITQDATGRLFVSYSGNQNEIKNSKTFVSNDMGRQWLEISTLTSSGTWSITDKTITQFTWNAALIKHIW